MKTNYTINGKVYDLAGARIFRDAIWAMENIEEACSLDPEFGAVFNAVLEYGISCHYYDEDVVPYPTEWFKGPGWYYEKFSPNNWKMEADPVGPYETDKEAYYEAASHYGLYIDEVRYEPED